MKLKVFNVCFGHVVDKLPLLQTTHLFSESFIFFEINFFMKVREKVGEKVGENVE